MNQKEFGNLIKIKRKEKNLTQSELAEKLNLSSYKTISKWENGIYMPDISLLIKLSEILEISLYELLGGKENMQKENVEKVLKTTIEFANKKLYLLRLTSIILSIILIIITVLFGIRLYKDHDYLFITKPENVNINDFKSHYSGLWDENDIISNNDFFTYYRSNQKNTGIEETIIKKLPLFKTKKNYSYIYPINRSIIYLLGNEYSEQNEDDINKTYRDDYYTKKAMFVNALVLFNKIDNLESVIFEYTDKKYEINVNHLKEHFNYITETHMCDNDGCNYLYHITFNDWQKDVIKKLNNKKFLDNFFDKIVKEKSVD